MLQRLLSLLLLAMLRQCTASLVLTLLSSCLGDHVGLTNHRPPNSQLTWAQDMHNRMECVENQCM